MSETTQTELTEALQLIRQAQLQQLQKIKDLTKDLLDEIDSETTKTLWLNSLPVELINLKNIIKNTFPDEHSNALLIDPQTGAVL